jgi:hypothetical protein
VSKLEKAVLKTGPFYVVDWWSHFEIIFIALNFCAPAKLLFLFLNCSFPSLTKSFSCAV